MVQLLRIATTWFACLTIHLALTAVASAQVSFEGQAIRLAIATTTGGPTDIIGRQLAPFFTKHIPGKPTVIVENRPGAGGAVTANYIYNLAKPDGLTIGFLFGAVTQGLMGGDGIRHDPAKFHWLGAVSQTQVLLARKDLNLASVRDLLKPAKPLILASVGTNSTADMANRIFLEMIGAKYQYVAGYPGQPEAMLALSRGEASLANLGHSLYLSRREAILTEGSYDAIVQRGEFASDGTFRRNKQLSGLSTTVEAIGELNPSALKSVDFATYRGIIGAFAVHFGLALPPSTPAPLVAILRKGIAAAFDDPEARQAVRNSLKFDYDFVNGQTTQGIIDSVRDEYNSDPRIAERLKQLMASK